MNRNLILSKVRVRNIKIDINYPKGFSQEAKVKVGGGCSLSMISLPMLVMLKNLVDREVRIRTREVDSKDLGNKVRDMYKMLGEVIKKGEKNVK